MPVAIDKEFIQARTWLRQHLPVGTLVHTILRHVSRSGMRREISTVIWSPESQVLLQPDHHVACVLGARVGKQNGVIVDGAGMDMGFDLVYRLGHALHGDGYALKQAWL